MKSHDSEVNRAQDSTFMQFSLQIFLGSEQREDDIATLSHHTEVSWLCLQEKVKVEGRK